MSNILIMNQNFVRSDFLTSQTYSSQIVAAPATNVYDTTRRTKVWRTQGYWNVTASNNKIILREAAGVDLTATIAVAEYTSDATFLTAIKTALEVPGVATYTVSRDASTNKIKILSGLDGGATVFQLRCNDVLFTAATTLGFSTATNLTGAAFYIADTLKIHTSEFLRWDLGSSTLIQAFSIIGTQKDGLKISSSAVVKLQGNSTDVWTAPTYEATLTYNQISMGLFDVDGLYPTGLRYWRLYITDASNPLGYIEISNVYLGQVFEPANGTVQFPFQYSYLDLSSIDRTDWGNTFADIRQVTKTLSLKWFGLDKTDCETLGDFITLYGTFYPFWISLDPNEVFSSDSQKWVLMCRFAPDVPSFTLEAPNVYSSEWSLREEV